MLAALARGLSSKQIGKELGISPETVRRHSAQLRAILGVHNVAALLAAWGGRLRPVGVEARPLAEYAALSRREREILTRIAAGCSSEKIAAALNISPSTVRKHRENILKKTGLGKMSRLIYEISVAPAKQNG